MEKFIEKLMLFLAIIFVLWCIALLFAIQKPKGKRVHFAEINKERYDFFVTPTTNIYKVYKRGWLQNYKLYKFYSRSMTIEQVKQSIKLDYQKIDSLKIKYLKYD